MTRHELGPLIRDYLRDRRYRATPIGQEAGAYLRALKWGGRGENTRDTYEIPLAKLSWHFQDFDSLDRFCAPDGTELLRDFLDEHWGESSDATRANRLSAIKGFFQWEVDERGLAYNPAAKIKPPRVRNPERRAHSIDRLKHLVHAQERLEDQAALMLLAMVGLRKNELRLIKYGDIDLARNELLVHGKGKKDVVLPLAFRDLRDSLYLLAQAEDRHPDEYLLHPKTHRRQPMDPSSVHRWFKRCLEQAGMSQSTQLHELRHSAADAIWRSTGDLIKAQMLLRHTSVATTQRYLHPTREDLAAGMRAVDAIWREE